MSMMGPHKYRSTNVCEGGGFTQQRCLCIKHHTPTNAQTGIHTASGEKLAQWLNCSCQREEGEEIKDEGEKEMEGGKEDEGRGG